MLLSLANVKEDVLSVSSFSVSIILPRSLSAYLGVQSPACKEDNLVCSKLGAHLVLKAVLGFEIEADCIPFQEKGIQFSNTIIEAQAVQIIDGVQVEVDVS